MRLPPGPALARFRAAGIRRIPAVGPRRTRPRLVLQLAGGGGVSPPCRAFAEPCGSGPVGSRLVLDSLVVEEVHHGRWTFGVCWDSPWYQTMPDQLVLRLRRIGITATLSMRDTS